ncbi:hypothetical protein DMUE_2418 [Dictyocoela muelleri]|nr:hypothetical protein DMUE_2418 [Dictyocoela muelleri]
MKSIFDDLPNYVKTKDYPKILRILKNKPSILTADQEDLLETQEEIIRIILRNDIRFFLCNRKPIDTEKIELSSYLGNDFFDEMGDIIRENLVERFFNVYQKDLEKNDIKNINLKNVNEGIKVFEEIFQKIIFSTAKFPDSWNIKGEFVFRIAIFLKEGIGKELIENDYKIAEAKFENNKDTTKVKNTNSGSNKKIIKKNKDEFKNFKNKFITGLEAIVDFEKKYTQRYFLKNCCSSKNIVKPKAIYFENGDVHFANDSSIKTNMTLFNSQQGIKDFCKHRKMLSRLFYNNLDLYVESLFSCNFNVQQDVVELKVMKGFILFYQHLAYVLNRIKYFDNSETFHRFVTVSDKKLTKMINSINGQYKIEKILVILNTLSFVETTFKDLLMKIFEKYNYIYDELECFKVKRRLENIESKKFEELIRSSLKNKLNLKFSGPVIKLLKERIFSLNLDEFSEDVQFFIFETIFSNIFSFIMKQKFTTELATDILFELSEIRRFLTKKYKIPMINVIEKYLKIFLCEPNDPKPFVHNFILHSGSLFSFNQILMMLKNQSYQRMLFVEYKKQTSSIQKKIDKNSSVI